MYQLPKPVQSPSLEFIHREYPSAAFLDPSTAFVSDGSGSLYILSISTAEGKSSAIGPYGLPPTSVGPTGTLPFRIHQAVLVSPMTAVALISSRNYENTDQDTHQTTDGMKPKHSPVVFDVWAVQFQLPFLGSSSNAISELSVLWRRQGEDVPIHTGYAKDAFLLIGSSIYREIGALPAASFEPSPEEIAPIPRQNEELDAPTADPEKPPPYSWTQTADSVTVAFPLPSTTLKSNIKVTFSPRTVTLHIQGTNITSIPFPHYSNKQLWDGISASSSLWTFDREADHSFGLLTLYLDKQHEGTKWMQVFASAGTPPASETNPEDVEVPETLDPSELWLIRESLEKYTAALAEGGDPSGLGLGQGIPSLASGELDDEVDSSIGRTAFLTWVGRDGGVLRNPNVGDYPFQLLSTVLPGIHNSQPSLVVKNNLDGPVFTLSDAKPPTWTHTSTFHALAFVLASKQDTRFTYHVPSKAVFTFENGTRYRGGNVYIYRAALHNEKWPKQNVLQVGDGMGGSLLGVGALVSTVGKTVILCLTEGQLVLIRDIL